MKNSIVIAGSAVLLASAAPLAAAAQTSNPPTGAAPGAGSAVEQVVVTARKQEETLVSTPVTVSAISATRLDSIGIVDFKSISNFVPNIDINSTFSYNGRANELLIIRGMTPSLGSNASVFVDGTPLTSGYYEGLDDVARVEVLKGPQTAYFGRSTFAGAINVVTKAPSNDYHARIDLTAGTDSLLDNRFTVEGPLIKDKLAVRINFRDYSEHGTYKNAADGTTLGDQSTYSGTIAVRYTPIDRLSINAFALLEKDDDGPSTFEKISSPQFNCNAGSTPGGASNFICGAIPSTSVFPLAQNQITQAFRTYVLANSTGTFNPLFKDQFLDHNGSGRKVVNLHGSVDYDFKFAHLTWLSAYNTSHDIAILDLDWEDTSSLPNLAARQTPAGTGTLFQNQLIRSEQYFDDWFQELHLASAPGTALHYLIGISYAHTETANLVSSQSVSGLSQFGLGAAAITNTPAVFGSISYDILHNLTFSVEGRYQSDEVKSYKRSSYMTPGSLIAGATFNKFTPRLILKYEFVPGSMVYASYSVGTNPGTFNTSQLNFSSAVQALVLSTTGAGEVVQPETLTNYEIGLKSQFFDRRAQVTLAAYHAIWSNQIVPYNFLIPASLNNGVAGTVVSVQTNIGQTELNGVELEGAFRPIHQLEFNGQFGYAGSSIKQYQCFSCAVYTGTTNVTGNSLFRAPKINASIDGKWQDAAFADFNYYLSTDYQYKGPIYADPTNLASTAPQSVFNFHVGLENGKTRVEAFVNNAFDNRGPTAVQLSSDSLRCAPSATNACLAAQSGAGANEFLVGQPELRRAGIRVTQNF